MDKKLMLAKAKELVLPTALKQTSGDYVKVDARQQSASGPAEIIAMYQEAINNDATYEDCNASALYYYGMPYNTLMAVCWCMIALG